MSFSRALPRPLYGQTMDTGSDSTAASLTAGLRDLVWGIESEVAQITRLSRHIDERVLAVNALRREAAQRLVVLDELVQAGDDGDLRGWLERACEVPLPRVTERFPDRLYTD